MRSVVLRIVGVGLLAAACAPQGSSTPVEQNGMLVYSQNGARQAIACDTRPIQLSGNHTAIRLTGYCRFVRIAGEHNDISVEVAPGGTIEITGAHNDVTWRRAAPGPAPALVDRGMSNSFHARG